MKKLKKGDQVLVTSGRDKGMKGEILRVLPKLGRVIVKGVGLYKRHVKPTQNREGGVVSVERPQPTAKLMLLVDGKPVRVGLKRNLNKVTRINKQTGKAI